MRDIIKFFICSFLIWIANTSFATEPTTTIQWLTYSESIFDQAKTSQKQILLFAQSPSCYWCQQMEKTTWQVPALINTVQTNFLPVKIDVDAQANLARHYRINSLPTVMILDSNNQIIKIFTGYFQPEFMEKNLLEIINVSVNKTNTTITQPETIQENHTTPILFSESSIVELQKKQLSIYTQFHLTPRDAKPFDISTFNYALRLAGNNNHIALQWLQELFTAYAQLTDGVWGGIFSGWENNAFNYQKLTATQAKTIEFYSIAYAYWKNPNYILAAKKLLDYVNTTLLSPEGVFYAGQAEFSNNPVENQKYYQLDAVQRQHLGLPSLLDTIDTADNAVMISALAKYYAASGDSIAQQESLKTAQWILANLSLPGGGFRHKKNANDKLYLKDTLEMGKAFINLYKITLNNDYLNHAVDAAKFIKKYFQNTNDKKGFISVIDWSNADAPVRLSVSENADLCTFTAILYSYTGDKNFSEMENNAYQYLYSSYVADNIEPASVLNAISLMSTPPPHIIVVGPKVDSKAAALYKIVLRDSPDAARIEWWDRTEGPLQNASVVYPVLKDAAAYVCSGYHCSFPIYQPQDLTMLIHNLNVSPLINAKRDLNKSPITTDDISKRAEQLLGKRNWFLIIVGFTIFGMLLSFTPCILPMMPIMASVIVGQTIGLRREKTFSLCLSYVFAMSATYAILGLLAGAFGVYIQAYMQQTWIILLFSLIFFALGLSMLDAYEIHIPRFMLGKMSAWSRRQKGGTYYGVIVMGILSTLIVSPCVSAPLAGVLSFITKTSDYILGGIGLFCMGFGMGLPLLIISIYSNNLLPKVAQWNDQIKIFFGLVSIGISIWILSRVLSREIILLLWSGYIIFVTIFMGIFHRTTLHLYEKFWKALTIMLFLYGVSLFLTAMLINADSDHIIGNTAVLPSNHFTVVKDQDELGKYLQTAKSKHLPVVLDFTANWCSSCVQLEHEVLSNPDVVALFKNFMLLRVDVSQLDSSSMLIVKKFNLAGPPMIIFYDSDGLQQNTTVGGDIGTDKFITILQALLPSH